MNKGFGILKEMDLVVVQYFGRSKIEINKFKKKLFIFENNFM